MIHAAVSHARTVMMLFALLLTAGIYSYMNIPKESSPDIPIPIIYVSVTHEGISPEDAVNLLIKPLEIEMRGIDGLDELEATAFEGGANLVVRFQAGFDNDKALQDVREKVDIAKAELPDDAEEPKVSEVNFSLFPILTIILAGDVGERTLKSIAEDLQDQIETVSAVLEANIGGIREEQVLIEVDRAKMESFNLSGQQLIQSIANNNQLVAAGSLELEQGRYAVKVPGLFKNVDELLNLPVFADDFRTVRIRDIGDVKLTFKDPTSITRVNGKPAVSIEVRKRIGENIIETVDAVKAIVTKHAESWPETIRYRFVDDESIRIRTMLLDLQNNVAVAILLVMVVVLMALGPRSALLVATAIPGAFLSGVMLLFALGFTTNIVVLFALILSVGMLVDGAIVVTELADVKLREGMRRAQAFTYAAQYMAWPIIASTATTLAAFLPLLFWPDIVGEFMKFMPLTLIFTLSASLAMALIFLPTIGALMPRPPAVPTTTQDPVYVQRYEALLTWALARPWHVVMSIVGVFVAVMISYGIFGHGVQFFPAIEPERSQIQIHAQGDLSIYEKDDVMHEASDRLLGLTGVKTLYVLTGSGLGRSDGPSDVIGTISLEYVDWADGRPRSETILADAYERLKPLQGVRVELNPEQKGPQDGKPINIVVTADHYNLLPPVIKEIQAQLEAFSGTLNVENDLPDAGIEWALHIDRAEAARFGTDVASAGSIIRLATNGAIVGTYRPTERDDEIDIVARFAANERSLSVIDDLTLFTSLGERVPLSHFTKREAQPKVSSIRRLDQKMSASVEADVAPGFLPNEIVQGMKEKLTTIELPAGVTVQFKGEDEKQATAANFLKNAFMVALFIMAIILVTQFNSFYQAFVILSAIILSTAGVLLGHLIMDKPFGIIMSGLGVISLAGIVVNNNIVLIDTFNKYIKEMDWHAAIIATGKSRVRPVMLTAITTIVGLIPMASRLNIDLFGRSIQYNSPSTQWWDQLASSIVFGLAFATILTLIVTPCMLALVHRRKK